MDGIGKDAPTHKIDNFKNRVGVEVEWNNKDPFFDRDLNNFRLLHQLDVLSVGVIITRLWELQEEFKELGKGASYGMNTTHFGSCCPKSMEEELAAARCFWSAWGSRATIQMPSVPVVHWVVRSHVAIDFIAPLCPAFNALAGK